MMNSWTFLSDIINNNNNMLPLGGIIITIIFRQHRIMAVGVFEGPNSATLPLLTHHS